MDSAIVSQHARQIPRDLPPEPMASLPWFHNVVLSKSRTQKYASGMPGKPSNTADPAPCSSTGSDSIFTAGRASRLTISNQRCPRGNLTWQINCIVIDLKVEPFKPEFAGKMNFYLSAADDLKRHTDQNPPSV
jgi:hypothetical protein